MSRDIAFPWTLEELSRQMFVGRFHLARTFAKCVGLPPMHYLARLRAERAAAMLASTDLPSPSIGAAVGWPDPAYFSRRFRAVFGISPREYRHRHSAARDQDPPGRDGAQSLPQRSATTSKNKSTRSSPPYDPAHAGGSNAPDRSLAGLPPRAAYGPR